MSEDYVIVTSDLMLSLVETLSQTELHLLSVLILNANEDGLTDIDNYKLAGYCGVSRESISRRISSLTKKKFKGNPIISITNFRPSVIKINELLGVSFNNKQAVYNKMKYEEDLGSSYRAIVGYNQWNKSVKKRDNYRCVKCKSNENIVAHHLESFAKNKELRLEISNGVTLCKTCHIYFHKKYGYHDFDEQKFRVFMEEVM